MACGQFRFFPHPQGVDGIFPRQGPVTGVAPATGSPAFPQCAHRPGAVLHKWSTWLCTAKPVRSSPARLAGSSPPACRCLREAAGTPDADLAWAWLTSSATAGAGARAQAARAPRRLPAVTLIVILPAARPRYAQAARAQSPPELVPPPALPRPGAGALGAGPPRRPGSAGDHRPATADAGALAPEASRCLPVLWPARVDGKPVGSTTGTRPGSWPQDPRSPHAAWPGPESLPHRALRDLRPVRSRICGRPIRPIRPGRRCSRDAAPGLAGQRSDRPARVCCRRGGSRAHCPPAAAARGLVRAVS